MYIDFVKLLSKLLGGGYVMWRGAGGGGQELNDFYSSSDAIRAIKSRRMRWVGNVARRRGGGRTQVLPLECRYATDVRYFDSVCIYRHDVLHFT